MRRINLSSALSLMWAACGVYEMLFGDKTRALLMLILAEAISIRIRVVVH